MGRIKGERNYKTKEANEIADRLGIDPFIILLHIAAGDYQALGYDSAVKIKVTKDGGTITEDTIPIELRRQAASDAVQYLRPKLKAIEHSGKVDQVHSFGPVTKQALIEAIKLDPFMDLPAELENGEAGAILIPGSTSEVIESP